MNMVKHLYVIGNGFDIHHGIKSRYSDFRLWLLETNCDLIMRMDEIYGFCDSNWWKDFENQLASFDILNYSTRIACENQPDLLSDHCDSMWNNAEFEVEKQLSNLYLELRNSFYDWIEQLNPPYRDRTISLSTQNSAFINFNYTKTLENLYGVHPRKILYIHGCVGNDSDLIFGYGKSYEDLEKEYNVKANNPKIDTSQKELSQFNEDNDFGLELHEQSAFCAAISKVASQRKPVQKLIQQNRGYFESLRYVQHVHIYGLSMSEVDLPYFVYFSKIFNKANWEFSAYVQNDRDKIDEFCSNNGIQNFKVIQLDDIPDTQQSALPFM